VAKSKSRLGTFVKLAVSAGLLAYVFARVDWSEFGGGLRRADPWLIALYLAVGPLMLWVSTLKWRLLLRAKGIRVSLVRLYALYFIGHFFNHLMPSNVGGDAVRAYKLGRETGSFQEALASIFVERLTGFTILLALALGALGLNAHLLGDPRLAVALMAGCGLGYAALLWAVMDARWLPFVTRRLHLPVVQRLAPRIEEVHWAIRSYRAHGSVWTGAIGLSVAFYVLVVANAWIGCAAFGAAAPLRSLVMAIPVILLISMIPISVGGLGLLEWGYFAVFEQVGLPGSLGLSVALLNRFAGLLMGGFGGILYGSSLFDAPADDGLPAEGGGSGAKAR
jgi:uncharacterized protein (TIRG00374 family)